MKILVTGAAGFIGAASTQTLLKLGHEILGVDNLNDYYDVNLKLARLERLQHDNFQFQKLDIADNQTLQKAASEFQPEIILHLAAQAGVRYSIENPDAYIQSNLVGFANILELARQLKIKHLVYASSSSVYGSNTKLPYAVSDNVDNPVSLYAATKKSNELMAHSYSHLYHIPCTGLRFFTVYGPWGRPDMAPMKFAKRIMAGDPIQVYNHGNHSRDFTYIDDIVNGIMKVIDGPTEATAKVYNIGRGQPMQLLDFIGLLEKALGKPAIKELKEKQAGDVDHTWADIDSLRKDFSYSPQTSLEEGIQQFAEWYLSFTK